MDSKIKDGHRLIISKEMETVPKSKGKEKARKELWDSLCAVYENEADKEIGELEMEEVDVCELEEWTVTNPDTSMRALTQLAVTNPQILSAALSTSPDNADLILELEHGDKKEIHEKQVNERTNKNIGSKTSEKCRCKSLSYMKSTKTFSPNKKCKKPRTLSQKEKLSVSLLRKKTEEKKLKCLMKLQKTLLNEEDSEIYIGKRKRKQMSIHSKESKKSINSSKVPKSYLNHKCKLEYRHYLKTKNFSARPDNRVFTCKLIFKVCHCTESDVVL